MRVLIFRLVRKFLFFTIVLLITVTEPMTKFHVKRASLLKIFIASDLVFIQDESEEMQETRRFIERQIAMYNFS